MWKRAMGELREGTVCVCVYVCMCVCVCVVYVCVIFFERRHIGHKWDSLCKSIF